MAEYTDTAYTNYIATLDKAAAGVDDGYRRRAFELVPSATEGTSYGMPALRYRGRPLITVVTSKGGYTAYPFSSDVVATVLPTLTGFAATKGGIKFTEAQTLPGEAFDRMVRERQAEIDAALGPSGGSRGR